MGRPHKLLADRVGSYHNGGMSVDTIIQAGGGPSKVGKQLGLHHASVIEWRKTGQVPVAHVLRLEQITGIPRHQLRPDVYPAPEAASSAAPATPAGPATPLPVEAPYGSLKWLTARRDLRPAVDVTSVELLNALHDEG